MPLPTELIITVSPGPQVAAREQHVPGRAERDLERGGLLVRDAVRDPDQVPRLDHDLLRVAAAGREADEAGRQAERLAAGAAVPALAARVHDVRVDAVAGRPALDALAELLDVARQLDAERVRQGDREAGGAVADVDVEVVERARPDPDEHLARPRARVVDLLDPQHVETPELVEPDCFHALDLLRRRTSPAFMSDFREPVKHGAHAARRPV